MKVLSLNPGSSSLKFALYEVSPTGETSLIRGLYDRLGSPQANCVWKGIGGTSTTIPAENVGLGDAVEQAIRLCTEQHEVAAVGCRVVHGGEPFRNPICVDDAIVEQIRALGPLAPLHNSRDVATIQAGRKALPNVPVIAVFDTGFHQTLPPHAFQYAIPQTLAKEMGIRRYGFHGISYSHSVRTLRNLSASLPSKLVICHLGSGASVCAVLEGKSVDTSMGFTPLEGLMMGTRSGDIDPGVLLYVMRERGLKFEDLDRLLNRESGLLGVSGTSADLRDIEQAAAEGDTAAELAISLFCYRIAKYIGAYAVALQGLDAVAFSGGIGEHSATVRRRVCAQLGFLGVSIDPELNNAPLTDSAAQVDARKGVEVWVVPADEERQIAFEVHALLSGQRAS